MTNQYRYILEKSSRKHTCPVCGKRRFVQYIDTKTGEYIPKKYGRCDREINCGYYLNPYKDGYNKLKNQKGKASYYGNWNWKRHRSIWNQRPRFTPIFFPIEVFTKTLKPEGYSQNTFIQNLLSSIDFPFSPKVIEEVVSLYYLGTIIRGYRAGAMTIPFIDKNRNVRAVQVKQFDKTNHTTATDFLHSILKKYYENRNESIPHWLKAYLKQDKKVSCLFGEHLLEEYQFNPIALVEAPKTAIYGTLYFGFPEQAENFLWLAVYNLNSLNYDKCKVLHGRDVYLFPDLSKDSRAFKLWDRKAKQLENLMPGTKFIVSSLLENHASEIERIKGYDLADYLIKQNWRKFR